MASALDHAGDGGRRIPLACTGDVASRLQFGGDVPQRALAVVDRIAVQSLGQSDCLGIEFGVALSALTLPGDGLSFAGGRLGAWRRASPSRTAPRCRGF